MDKMICTNIFFNFWLKLYSVWKNARLLKLNCYLLFTVGSRAAKCSWFGPYTILCALRDCFILHEPRVLIVFKDCLLFTFILMSFWSLIAYWLAFFFFYMYCICPWIIIVTKMMTLLIIGHAWHDWVTGVGVEPWGTSAQKTKYLSCWCYGWKLVLNSQYYYLWGKTSLKTNRKWS